MFIDNNSCFYILFARRHFHSKNYFFQYLHGLYFRCNFNRYIQSPVYKEAQEKQLELISTEMLWGQIQSIH